MRKIDQLTFTRFLASIAIIIYHFGTDVFPFNQEYISAIVRHADVSVSYFYILSGFVMVIAYSKGKDEKIDPQKYYINRVARIFPVYIIALFLVIVHRYVTHTNVNLLSALLSGLGLQAWVPAYALDLNWAGWSISVELLFYALFPFLCNKIFPRYRFRTLALLSISFWLVSQIAFNWLVLSRGHDSDPSVHQSFSYYFPLMHLNEFIIGNLAGLFYLRLDQKYYRNHDVIIVLIVLVSFVLTEFALTLNYHNGLMAVLFVPLIILLSLNTGFITKLFSNSYLVYLGEISFGIYILQKPVSAFSDKLFELIGIQNRYSAFYLYLVTIIICSMVCYKVIEVPMRDRIRSLRFKFK